jgi:hypothetical protein
MTMFRAIVRLDDEIDIYYTKKDRRVIVNGKKRRQITHSSGIAQ